MTTTQPISAGHPKDPSTKGRYRPEIDGLRAFAVIAVIINHFNKDLLPGGYLGVDIFFVISGYVITSSLHGRPSKDFKDFIGGFYERRIKRLVPALSAFALISSILICLFNPSPEASLKTGIASLFGLSNLYLFGKSTDYFAQSTELNLFTHTWSLGVEEQFYILFPFLIWLSGFGRQTKNGARNLFFMIGTLTIASLAGFLYLYPSNQPAAYFLMPSRFWEMAAGCLIFIGFQKRASVEQLLEKVPPLLIIASIIGVMYLPISFAPEATVAIVVLSSVLIACLKKKTAAFRVFTNPRVVYIGLISYSLYLWHWGVLSISRWTIGIHWWSVPLQIALMLYLAIASYQWIETPLRKRAWFDRRWKTLSAGLGALITVSGGLIVINESIYSIIFLGKEVREEAGRKPLLSEEQCPSSNDLKGEALRLKCTLASANGKQIVAVGDSQMQHLIPLLNKLNADNGYGIKYYSSDGTNFPSLPESRNDGKTLNEHLPKSAKISQVYETYFSGLKKGDSILLSSRYELRWGKRPIPLAQRDLKFTFYDHSGKPLDEGKAHSSWKKLFEKIAEDARRKNVNVIVIKSVPTFPDLLPRGLTNPEWFNILTADLYTKPLRHGLAENYAKVDKFFDSLESKNENVHTFDAFEILCPKHQQFCYANQYSDQWHLSRDGALTLHPHFLDLLKRIDQ